MSNSDNAEALIRAIVDAAHWLSNHPVAGFRADLEEELRERLLPVLVRLDRRSDAIVKISEILDSSLSDEKATRVAIERVIDDLYVAERKP